MFDIRPPTHMAVVPPGAPARARASSVRAAYPLWLPVLLAVAVGAVLVLWWGGDIIDDAYISMRYAVNIAHGHGPVFNPGERVEGFSNPSMTLLLALVSAVGLPVPAAAVAIGIAAFLATVGVSVVLASRLGAPPFVAGAVGMLVATTGQLVASSTNGLETTLFAFALAASVLMLSEPESRPWLLGAALFLLATTRPEGPVLVLVLLATAIVTRRRASMGLATTLRAGFAVAALVAAALTIRFAYYGEWVPTSVIAKRDLDTGLLTAFLRHAPEGLGYLRDELGLGFLIVVAVLLTAALVAWRPVGQGAVIAATTASAVIVGVLLVLQAGRDWMPHARMIVPYLPVALVVLVTPLLAPRSTRLVVPITIAVIAVMQPWGALHGGFRLPGTPGAWTDFGAALAQRLPEGTEVTTSILGAVPYAAPGVRFFDVYGLAEPSVATLPTAGGTLGKDGSEVAAARNNVMVLMNHWMSLDRVVGESTKPYVAMVSRQLVRNNLFVAVRADRAARIGTISRGAHFVSWDRAVDYWSAQAPNGQTPYDAP